MKYIFDSSFLLSLYILEDVNHKKALDIFATLPDNSIFYINELTYIELLTVITYKKWFNFISKMKTFIQDSNTFFINSWNLEYIRYFEMLWKKISIVDISILYDSNKYDCKILSFDKEILKIEKKFNF
jgi:predicted nucleic acid-binding protein